MINKDKIAIFGGSWGGYCALASIAFYPELFRCGISMFGVTDINDMLINPQPDSGSIVSLNKLQFGDIASADEANKLKMISPINITEKIQVPVLIFHNYQDTVVSFGQSKRFLEEMSASGGRVKLISADGNHGFTPDAESHAYGMLVDFIGTSMLKDMSSE